MDSIELESQSKLEKRERNQAAMERIRRREIFESRGLTEEEIARISTMSAGDSVSNYIGYPAVQADMIIAERKGAIRQKIERVVEGIGNFIGVPPLK